MDHLSKCLFSLEAISKIQSGSKVSTRGDVISPEKESYVQWLWRLSDSRVKAFRTIKQQIANVIEISSRTMESKYLLPGCDHILRIERLGELKKIYHNLVESKRGVSNLQDTYAGDNDATASAIDIIVDIEKQCTVIKMFLKSLDEDV